MFEVHFFNVFFNKLLYFCINFFIWLFIFLPFSRTFNLMSLKIKVKNNNIFVPESFCLLVAPHDFNSANVFQLLINSKAVYLLFLIILFFSFLFSQDSCITLKQINFIPEIKIMLIIGEMFSSHCIYKLYFYVLLNLFWLGWGRVCVLIFSQDCDRS